MSRPRVGVFGGTFDPIHIGHLAAADDAAAQLRLERVLFVPNHVPPHKRDRRVSAPADRVAMVELAIADNPRFELSLVEIERDGPSYTLDTMRVLREQLPDTELLFLAGCDALNDLHTWHEPATLLAEFDLAFLARPDPPSVTWETVHEQFPGIEERIAIVSIPALEISGHAIRRRVRDGRPIRYYVPVDVERYIRVHRLYLESPAL